MRLYLEVARRAFRRATVYRSAYVAGILTNAFFGALRSFVFIALYRATGGADQVAGFSLPDVLSYTWATQSLISIGGGWIFGADLMTSIRTGNVVTDLMRPWNFYGYWLSRSLGERGFNLLVRGSLTYLIGVLYFGAHIPSPSQLLTFAATIALALLVSFAFSFMVSLTAFWLIDNTGLLVIANIMLSFFSGFLLPINFFPAWLAAIARALPFQAVTQLPAEALLGRLGGAALIEALALQAFWACALTALALLLLRSAVQKVVVQGG